MEWLAAIIANYGLVTGGAFGGIVTRLTREPPSWPNTARAVGTLPIIIPLAHQISGSIEIGSAINRPILIAAILAFCGERVLTWIARDGWRQMLRTAISHGGLMPPPANPELDEMAEEVDRQRSENQ